MKAFLGVSHRRMWSASGHGPSPVIFLGSSPSGGRGRGLIQGQTERAEGGGRAIQHMKTLRRERNWPQQRAQGRTHDSVCTLSPVTTPVDEAPSESVVRLCAKYCPRDSLGWRFVRAKAPSSQAVSMLRHVPGLEQAHFSWVPAASLAGL